METATEPVASQTPEQTKPAQRIVYPLATWLALRKDYVNGKGTLEVLCGKHGVNYQTACTKAHHEQWTEQRRTWVKRAQTALAPPEQATEQTVPEPGKDQPQTKLAKVEQQLKAIDEALEHANAKELPNLWKAKSMALDAWSLLTGFPRPGVRRQSKQSRPVPTDPEPVPTPQPVVTTAPVVVSPVPVPPQDKSGQS